jgi:folylpolyglutamate synthase/dihydropteroate synthase
LAPLVSDWFLAAVDESRALAPKQLRLALPDSAQETAKICPGISAALAKALTNCPQSEAIIVFGSFPVVGEALEYLARQDQTGS